MKVLLVDQFGRTTGRDTLALAELINKNEDIELEVFLSDNTEIPIDREYNLRVTKGFNKAYEGNFINKSLNYLKALRELKKYIKNNNFDIVHLQWFSIPWIEWIYVGQLKKKCKVIITVHDVIPFDNRPLEMKALDKIYSKADQLLVHTETSKKLFKDNYHAKPPITVITQGFCLKSDYCKLDSKKAKMHFGIPLDSIVFLYYGTIRPSKGIDYLIRAIHKAHKLNHNVYLLAAGALHKVNENELLKLVNDELSSEFSTVKIGFVPQEEEKWYFSAADVLCLPYLEVTQSGVAQLGLMYDLPIIATDVGEMRSVCRNNQNGILVTAGDEKQLKDAIVRMTGDNKFRQQASKVSCVLGKNEFSLTVKAQKVYDSYKQMVINCEGKDK